MLGLEKDAIEDQAFAILADVRSPCWVFVSLMVVRLRDLNLVPLPMLDEGGPVRFSFEYGCPHSELIALTLVLLSIPVVEVSELPTDEMSDLVLTIDRALADGAHSL